LALRVGVVGLGRMGRRHLLALAASPRWQLVWACDRDPEQLAWAREQVPDLRVGADAEALIGARKVDAVGLYTLADARPGLIRTALATGAHVLAEKPLAATPSEEQEVLAAVEASDRLVAVNLFNRNAWYHRTMIDFVRRGEIGRPLSVDVAHLTPDLLPTEGHLPEGPPFQDCGMHYVDLARWYADSEYAGWHAQGLRLWAWPDPWWVDVHGGFANGMIFHLAQTFAYGQQAAQVTARSSVEVVGTAGVARMRHDFAEVVVELHGRSSAETKRGAYTGKNLDVFVDTFADSIAAGRNLGFPTARDSVLASGTAQQMLDEATADAPVIGGQDDLAATLAHKAALRAAGRAFPEALLDG
jgi:predicted dehydrogenase